MMNFPGWQVDIGLEIHAQLNTASKIFSGSATAFGATPNQQASFIDMGLPGVLPVANGAVFEKAVRFGLGIGAKINRVSKFDRKNYFYPDLPKGYQITQMDEPIVLGGQVTIETEEGEKIIRITRAHLEEDAGKSVHDAYDDATAIDLNRAGTPLLEIVSEPDMKSAADAVAYARKIHQLVTYLDVCDGNMAEGSLRFDANISVRRVNEETLGVRSEIKNLNSFRFLEQAIHFEIERQIQTLESGGSLIQDTRLFDPDRKETRQMRSKETSTDYRYFPEPDLLPVELSDTFIDQIQAGMPELPDEKSSRFQSEYHLTEADARLLANDLTLANYFEAVAQGVTDPKTAANWIKGDLIGKLNETETQISSTPVSPKQLVELIGLIEQDVISGKIAKDIFQALWSKEADSPRAYVEEKGLKQVSDAGALEPLIQTLIDANPKQANDLREGKDKLMGFFVGQVMKQTSGQANPQQVNRILRNLLGL
jgi:aspartyl-tRNA(Asn)/glutamyl-tRNA(Gln) amidotransferase subunit B